MRKNNPGCENSLDTTLKEETQNHEVEHQLPKGDCREEHKLRKVKTRKQSLLTGVVQIKENLLMDP